MLKNENTSAKSQELNLFVFTNMVVSNRFFNIIFFFHNCFSIKLLFSLLIFSYNLSYYLNPKILLWKKKTLKEKTRDFRMKIN
jgi:hypothetical protein